MIESGEYLTASMLGENAVALIPHQLQGQLLVLGLFEHRVALSLHVCQRGLEVCQLRSTSTVFLFQI